jgi:hypothetical protein
MLSKRAVLFTTCAALLAASSSVGHAQTTQKENAMAQTAATR